MQYKHSSEVVVCEDAADAPTMSAEDDEESGVEQELALDLWEGQFEFVGEGYGGDGVGGGLEDSGVCTRGGGGGLTRVVTPPPRLGSNGVRKTEAHLWCEDLTEQVSVTICMESWLIKFFVCYFCITVTYFQLLLILFILLLAVLKIDFQNLILESKGGGERPSLCGLWQYKI